MTPSAEAYAAARAAQAARLIGARYGTEADDYLDHVRLAVHTMNDDVAAAESVAQVAPAAPPPITVTAPTAVAVAVAAPKAKERPRRHRRGIVILVGGFLAAVTLGMSSIGLSAMTPSSDATATPSGSGAVIAGGSASPSALPSETPSATPTPEATPTSDPSAMPSDTATPSASSTATPTRAPTPRPTPKPTVKPTPKPPALTVAWQAGHNPPAPPTQGTWNFYIQTVPGAECRVWRIGPDHSGGPDTTRYSFWYPSPPNGGVGAGASGQIHDNWASYNWIAGATYSVWAQCRRVGTTTVVSNTPINLTAV